MPYSIMLMAQAAFGGYDQTMGAYKVEEINAAGLIAGYTFLVDESTTEGEGTLTSEGETFPLRPGTSLFLPAGTAPAEVFSEAGCTLLMTQIGP